MDYTRREALRLAAAGAFVTALPLFFRDTAHAEEGARPPASDIQGPGKSTTVLPDKEGYEQSKADEIHNRIVEQEIEKAGEKPEEVKKQVERRLQDLKEDLPSQADTGGLSRALEALKNR